MSDPIEFGRVEDAVEDLRAGKLILLVDDEDRENEGDFVMAAEKVTPEALTLMTREGSGIIIQSGNAVPSARVAL